MRSDVQAQMARLPDLTLPTEYRDTQLRRTATGTLRQRGRILKRRVGQRCYAY
jgi:hypothetical protein